MGYTETHARTIAKTVLYRVISVISVVLLSLAFGVSQATAGFIGLLVLVLGVVAYYIHDRVWNRYSWGVTDASDAVKRSIVKSVIYRLIVMAMAFTGAKILVSDDNAVATAWMVSQMVINLVVYYAIERIFNRISWGKII